MSESKRRKNLREKLLEEHPYCIYCGGKTRADTLDHVPARSFFDERDRPKGLEVPACSACNKGAGGMELIIALVSRIYIYTTNDVLEHESGEYAKKLERRFPGLLNAMLQTNPEQDARAKAAIGPEGSAFTIDIPIVHDAILRFSAKMGYALHFYVTGGDIIQEDGGACAQYFTNAERIEGEREKSLQDFQKIVKPKTLKQGIKEVGDQFKCWSEWASSRENEFLVSTHLIKIREILGIIVSAGKSDLISEVRTKHPSSFYAPGFLKKPLEKFEAQSIMVSQ